MFLKAGLPAIILLTSLVTYSQDTGTKIADTINTSAFRDNSGHWYGITDKEAVIHARPGRPRYKSNELMAIADNILLYQKDNGGWPKNYDMMAILTPDQKDSVLQSKHASNTTFDNNTTYTQIASLAQVYSITKKAAYKEAALKGLDFIIKAQYDNGGWPQYYPVEENNYSRYITYNDGAFAGIMWMLKDIKEGKPQYSFIDKDRRDRLATAFEKGLDCIIKTQINDAGKPTAWCQQYDAVTLEPTWARKFEPPSICNGESSDIVLLLMSIDKPDKKVITAVDDAVAWFNASKIYHTRVQVIRAPELVTPFRVSHTDRVVVNDPQAPPIWTRYYELKTHRPLFCNRDSKVVYSLAEVARERRDGYGWYTYDPQKVLDRYDAWKKKWANGTAAR